MKPSQHDQHYYNALHDVFSVDYHDINQYVLELYSRPKQFIAETGPPLERFLREYTLPGAPGKREIPACSVLDFIGQIDEFTSETVGLFDEHKAYVDQCDRYLQKVTLLRAGQSEGVSDRAEPEFAELTPELLSVHQGLKKIKEKADSMAEKLERLQTRWTTIKSAINR